MPQSKLAHPSIHPPFFFSVRQTQTQPSVLKHLVSSLFLGSHSTVAVAAPPVLRPRVDPPCPRPNSHPTNVRLGNLNLTSSSLFDGFTFTFTFSFFLTFTFTFAFAFPFRHCFAIQSHSRANSRPRLLTNWRLLHHSWLDPAHLRYMCSISSHIVAHHSIDSRPG